MRDWDWEAEAAAAIARARARIAADLELVESLEIVALTLMEIAADQADAERDDPPRSLTDELREADAYHAPSRE